MELKHFMASVVFWFTVAVYLCFVAMLWWSAVRHRRAGWISGVLLSIMLGTIPVWVGGLFWLYQLIAQ
jgi:hypothetical protein